MNVYQRIIVGRTVGVIMSALVLAALVIVAMTACSQGTEELYARERAMPAKCLEANPMTAEQAQAKAGYLLPTIPITVELVQASNHLTHRDKITGAYTIQLVPGFITGMSVAHELAHVATFDSFSGGDMPGTSFKDSKQRYVAIHGPEFVQAYKLFLTQLVSKECSDAL